MHEVMWACWGLAGVVLHGWHGAVLHETTGVAQCWSLRCRIHFGACRVIVAFTALQFLYVGGVYGITWIHIVGSIFPVPILLLVPIRQYIMPWVGHLSCLSVRFAAAGMH